MSQSPQSDDYDGTPEERIETLKAMILRDFEVQQRLQNIIGDLRADHRRRWLWYSILFLWGLFWGRMVCT